MNTAVVEALRDRRLILFVGAGVSQNLGLPSFAELVAHIGESLGYESELFRMQGDYLTLCEFYALEKGGIGSLRSWMDRTWHDGRDIAASEIHRLIVELDFPVIYTTNFDHWLERAHDVYGKPYTKISKVSDIPLATPGATQIIKYHGDFEADESLVLTESQYFARLDFESPLDIKLRSDLLGKSVLFIGYSMTDINVRYMLYRLNEQWKKAGLPGPLAQSYMFLTRPNPAVETVLQNRGVQPIVSGTDDPGVGLTLFLRQLAETR